MMNVFTPQAISLSSGYVVFAKSTTDGGQLVAYGVKGEVLWSAGSVDENLLNLVTPNEIVSCNGCRQQIDNKYM